MSTQLAQPATAVGVSIELDALHDAVADAGMDSMRLLSETGMRYPEAISFASGRPYEGFFKLSDLHDYLDRYVDLLRAKGMPEERIIRSVFQYGPTHGLIRDSVAKMLDNDEHITVPPEAVLITHGAQEAMMVVLRGLFAGPDDVLLTVSPCYVGIIGAAHNLDIPLEPVAEGEFGINPEEVAAAARRVRESGRRPVACYVTPDFSNPSGSSLPVAIRKRLLEVAAQENLLLLEDNPYGLFGPEGAELPTLKALDDRRRVIYLGTFSKSAFPGARVGYLVADQPVTGDPYGERLLAEELAKVKSMFSVGTSGVAQAMIGGLLDKADYRLRPANRKLADLYVRHMELTMRTLAEEFPAARYAEHRVRWNVPAGGFFVVLDVPFVADLKALDRSAREYGVGWSPMDMFYVGGGGEHQLRLGPGSVPTDKVAEGVRRLARFIRDASR